MSDMVNTDLTPDELAELLRLPGGGDFAMRRVRAGEWPCLRYSKRVVRFTPEHVEQIRALVAVTPTVAPTPTVVDVPQSRFGRVSNHNADRRRAVAS